MVRKDYVKFAKLLKGELTLARDSAKVTRVILNIRNCIGDIFAHDNKRFNRQKFYNASNQKKVIDEKTILVCLDETIG